MIFTCPLLSWYTISYHSKENSNAVVSPFPFNIFMPLSNLGFIRLQEEFFILRASSCSSVPQYIPSLPMLSVYGVAHSLLLGVVDRDFPFIEDETHTALSLLEIKLNYNIFFKLKQSCLINLFVGNLYLLKIYSLSIL